MSHSPQEDPILDAILQFTSVWKAQRENAAAFIQSLNDRRIPFVYSDGVVLVESKATREDER